MKFYRYKDRRCDYRSIDFSCDLNRGSFWHGGANIDLIIFDLVKETSKGYWIKEGDFSLSKWVSSTSRKRYAYPTKEEAMINFKARKNAQIKILRRNLEQAENALNKAINMGRYKL